MTSRARLILDLLGLDDVDEASLDMTAHELEALRERDDFLAGLDAARRRTLRTLGAELGLDPSLSLEFE